MSDERGKASRLTTLVEGWAAHRDFGFRILYSKFVAGYSCVPRRTDVLILAGARAPEAVSPDIPLGLLYMTLHARGPVVGQNRIDVYETREELLDALLKLGLIDDWFFGNKKEYALSRHSACSLPVAARGRDVITTLSFVRGLLYGIYSYSVDVDEDPTIAEFAQHLERLLGTHIGEVAEHAGVYGMS